MQKIIEYDAVSATVQKYIDGIATSDTNLITEAFHSQATMSGHFPAPDDPKSLVFCIVPAGETIVNYMKAAPPTSESSPDFSGRIISIEIYDSIATATITEQGLEGADFITHFHLHKVDGAWLITSKATYAEPIN